MGERSLILRQLTQRLGELPQDAGERVETLCLEQLENLGVALLDKPFRQGRRQLCWRQRALMWM